MDLDPEYLPRRLLTDFSIYNTDVGAEGASWSTGRSNNDRATLFLTWQRTRWPACLSITGPPPCAALCCNICPPVCPHRPGCHITDPPLSTPCA